MGKKKRDENVQESDVRPKSVLVDQAAQTSSEDLLEMNPRAYSSNRSQESQRHTDESATQRVAEDVYINMIDRDKEVASDPFGHTGAVCVIVHTNDEEAFQREVPFGIKHEYFDPSRFSRTTSIGRHDALQAKTQDKRVFLNEKVATLPNYHSKTKHNERRHMTLVAAEEDIRRGTKDEVKHPNYRQIVASELPRSERGARTKKERQVQSTTLPAHFRRSRLSVPTFTERDLYFIKPPAAFDDNDDSEADENEIIRSNTKQVLKSPVDRHKEWNNGAPDYLPTHGDIDATNKGDMKVGSLHIDTEHITDVGDDRVGNEAERMTTVAKGDLQRDSTSSSSKICVNEAPNSVQLEQQDQEDAISSAPFPQFQLSLPLSGAKCTQDDDQDKVKGDAISNADSESSLPPTPQTHVFFQINDIHHIDTGKGAAYEEDYEDECPGNEPQPSFQDHELPKIESLRHSYYEGRKVEGIGDTVVETENDVPSQFRYDVDSVENVYNAYGDGDENDDYSDDYLDNDDKDKEENDEKDEIEGDVDDNGTGSEKDNSYVSGLESDDEEELSNLFNDDNCTTDDDAMGEHEDEDRYDSEIPENNAYIRKAMMVMPSDDEFADGDIEEEESHGCKGLAERDVSQGDAPEHQATIAIAERSEDNKIDMSENAGGDNTANLIRKDIETIPTTRSDVEAMSSAEAASCNSNNNAIEGEFERSGDVTGKTLTLSPPKDPDDGFDLLSNVLDSISRSFDDLSNDENVNGKSEGTHNLSCQNETLSPTVRGAYNGESQHKEREMPGRRRNDHEDGLEMLANVMDEINRYSVQLDEEIQLQFKEA